MRILYFILFITLKYALRIYYPRMKSVHSPKGFFGRTIYVSNHAAAFMDPLVVASFRSPIVFFMTRSDIFTKLTKPILWAAHMLPIYRQQDGVDTKDENKKVFDTCARILNFGRNLLIFGEGFTDDVFIRRLKPLKKGAVRIGFYSLEKINWKKKIYIAAVGCNYSDPNLIGSDFLISTSKRICLNDYKTAYLENPNKVITDLTKLVEQLLIDQITHIEDKNNSNFHENVMKITRKGMNALHSNTKTPLVTRWQYSQKLANWFNQQSAEKMEELASLKDGLERYFSLLNKLRVNENYVFHVQHNTKLARSKELLALLTLTPFAILGVLHCGLIYFVVKRFVEKTFKRRVFWGSVKLIVGMIAMGIVNIPVIFVFTNYIYPSYLLAFLYYSLIGLFGLAAYYWWRNFTVFKEKGVVQRMDLSGVIAKRKALLEQIHREIPVA